MNNDALCKALCARLLHLKHAGASQSIIRIAAQDIMQTANRELRGLIASNKAKGLTVLGFRRM